MLNKSLFINVLLSLMIGINSISLNAIENTPALEVKQDNKKALIKKVSLWFGGIALAAAAVIGGYKGYQYMYSPQAQLSAEESKKYKGYQDTWNERTATNTPLKVKVRAIVNDAENIKELDLAEKFLHAQNVEDGIIKQAADKKRKQLQEEVEQESN